MVTGSPPSEYASTRSNVAVTFEGFVPTSMRAQYVPAHPLPETLMFRAVKRVADVAIATFGIIVCSPIFLFVSIAIWAEDQGPILYRQPRLGRFGVPFWFFKFRSMRVDADRIREELLHRSDAQGAAFKMKNDPRITKIGRLIRKYSIDELPQLFSVLAGHMSIVGPRPHLAAEVATYAPEQHARLFVKPGLLCLREVKGRSHLSFEEWVRLDLEYVRTRSLWLDTKIIFMAVPAILKGDGAY